MPPEQSVPVTPAIPQPPVPAIKPPEVYSTIWVALGTFFGGPFGGVYLLSHNFKTLNHPGTAKKVFWIGLLLSALYFIVLHFLPAKILGLSTEFIGGFLSIALIGVLAEQTQDKEIKQFLSSGGKQASGWKAFFISLLILLISYIYAILLQAIFLLV